MLLRTCLLSAALTTLALVGPSPASAQSHDDHAPAPDEPGASPTAPFDGRGELRVRADADRAIVRVDGDRVGHAPYRGRLAPGRHRVEVEAEGRKRWRGDVQVAAGQVTEAAVELEPAVSRGAGWGMLVMTALSAGAGVGLWYYADGIETDLQADRDAGVLASNDPRIRKGRLLTIGADIAFGSAALFGVLAMVYFLRDPHPDSSAEVHVAAGLELTPYLDPVARRGGAQLRWTF